MKAARALRPAALAVVFLSLSAEVCQGPTEPVQAQTYILAIEGTSVATGTFETADGRPAILEFQALLDGTEIASTTLGSPAASIAFSGRVTNARRGRHTLTLRVSAQSSSPTVYRSAGLKAVLATNDFANVRVATVLLPDQTKVLATGDAIVLEFDV